MEPESKKYAQENNVKSTVIKIPLKINPQLLQFLIVFGSLLFVFYYATILFEMYVPVFNIETTATTLAYLLKMLGVGATIDSANVQTSAFVLSVVRQCTGLFEAITLLACILAYPTNWKNKLKGIAMGLPLIYVFNIVRLIFLALLGIQSFSLFEFFHDYILQITFMSLVIGIWFFWIQNVVKRNVPSV